MLVFFILSLVGDSDEQCRLISVVVLNVFQYVILLCVGMLVVEFCVCEKMVEFVMLFFVGVCCVEWYGLGDGLFGFWCDVMFGVVK